MILKDTRDKMHSMTLCIVAHSDTGIVLATDTLAVDLDKQKIELGHKKIFDINSHTALVLAGNFHDLQVKQLIRDFAYYMKEFEITDIHMIFNRLTGYINATYNPPDGDFIHILLAGFSMGIPSIYYIAYSDGVTTTDNTSLNYDAIGYVETANLAKSLLSSYTIEKSTIEELESIVYKVIDQCKKKDGRLGGDNDKKVLIRP
jgi:20S proteasome alpha/beta subunit